MNAIIAIAAGGALGALARHYVNIGVSMMAKIAFPFGTLSVNVLGCFCIGALIAVFAHLWNPGQSIKLFLITGFLGAFTTFSTFSLDVMTLYSRGAYLAAGSYIGASVFLSLAGVFAGHFIVSYVLSLRGL